MESEFNGLCSSHVETISVQGNSVLSSSGRSAGRVVVVVIAVVVTAVGTRDDERAAEVGRKSLGALHGDGLGKSKFFIHPSLVLEWKHPCVFHRLGSHCLKFSVNPLLILSHLHSIQHFIGSSHGGHFQT